MNHFRIVRNVVVVGSFALFSSGAFALSGNAQKEIKTAAEHAGFAAGATSVTDTHMHLHHAINCMVGPNGAGYDAKFADPCKGQGNGAMNDIDNQTSKAMVQQALSLAEIATQVDNEAAARDTANAVRQLLIAASKERSM